MVLSYSLRVICLIGATLALLQVATEVLLWMGAPAICRAIRYLPQRQQERTLYLVQLQPVLIATLMTGLFFLPQYVSNETNPAPEHVGLLSVLLAVSLYAWWGAKAVCGIRIVGRTMNFSRACRLEGNSLMPLTPGAPIVSVSHQAPHVALVGLRRPFIMISKSLVEEGGLNPLALQIVLDHEKSHAAQRDNWKLLSLHCLPRLGMVLPGRKTWMQLWQNSAEWAADDDAVRGSSAHALILAETLVALARTQAKPGRQTACTFLVDGNVELALRVDRLLHRPLETCGMRPYKAGLMLGFVGLSGAVGLAALLVVLRSLPEHLLHLG